MSFFLKKQLAENQQFRFIVQNRFNYQKEEVVFLQLFPDYQSAKGEDNQSFECLPNRKNLIFDIF